MDLALFVGVLWRHRLIVIAGVIAAGVLTWVSLSHRGQEVWESRATLFVTQQDFPWGRAVEEYVPADEASGTPPAVIGDPQRLTQLATLYSQLANGEPVREAVREVLPPGDLAETASVQAAPVVDSDSGPLPLIEFTSTAPTPQTAERLAGTAADAFLAYLAVKQNAAGIPENARVAVETLSTPSRAELVDGPSNVLPILVFIGVLVLTVALAFVAENLRRTNLRAALVAVEAQGDAKELDAESEDGELAQGPAALPAPDRPDGDAAGDERRGRLSIRRAARASAERGGEPA